NNERYIPIKFSVRGRDLAGTAGDVLTHIRDSGLVSSGLRRELAGQFDQLRDEQRRLAVVVPVSLLVILFLLYTTFGSFTDAFLVLATVPFALVGGILSLVLTRTHFSISAAMGIISLVGLAHLGYALLISHINQLPHEGIPRHHAHRRSAE